MQNSGLPSFKTRKNLPRHINSFNILHTVKMVYTIVVREYTSLATDTRLSIQPGIEYDHH